MSLLQSSQLQPDAKKTSVKKVILPIIGVLILLIASIWFFSRPVGNSDAVVTIVIPPATGLSDTAAALKKENVIRSPFLFQMYATVTGSRSKIKAGTYAIEQNKTMGKILKQLTTGKRGDDVTLKVIEGWTEDQAVAEMQKIGLDITEAEIDAAIQEIVRTDRAGAKKYAVLFEGVKDADIPTLSSEGYLYPDTYKVFTNATAKEIVTKMLDNMNAKLTAEDLDAIKESKYSFYELLTVASIVEREVSTAADRKMVGGIFLRRLADDYPLQSDATVNYVTGKKTTTPSFNDTKVQSAYNTYQNAGLPPTPISNPSITAIQGVLDPTPSEYYFFLTTKEGEAKYSETYEKHLQYKQQYYGN